MEGQGIYGKSLCFLLNFPVNLKLPPKIWPIFFLKAHKADTCVALRIQKSLRLPRDHESNGQNLLRFDSSSASLPTPTQSRNPLACEYLS